MIHEPSTYRSTDKMSQRLLEAPESPDHVHQNKYSRKNFNLENIDIKILPEIKIKAEIKTLQPSPTREYISKKLKIETKKLIVRPVVARK